jgi:speckle-type POZ protein
MKSKLLCDFGYLYKDMVLSDVELEVGGKVLKAHKVILMSRSSVFKAMFSHNTLEAAKNRVVIKDFDFQTVQELLRYIYCEKVENLEDIALNLIAAADYVSIQN